MILVALCDNGGGSITSEWPNPINKRIVACTVIGHCSDIKGVCSLPQLATSYHVF